MNEVLTRKLGLPISLSVLYALVCREVKISIDMIGMVCPTLTCFVHTPTLCDIEGVGL